MAVNPIDLQVNFNQMNQVSKQQNLTKDNEILRQDNASNEIKKNSDKDSMDVPETKDLKNGPLKIKENESKKEKKKNLKNNKQNSLKVDKKNEKKEEENKKDLIDPKLGQKIDIIG